MQTKKRHPSLTDRRLRQLLKQLREEPAAPQDFRVQVLARLERQGVLPASVPASRAAAPGWAQRLQVWLRPAALGLAAAGALALLLFLRPVAPVPVPVRVAVAPAVIVAGPARVSAPVRVVARRRKSTRLAAVRRRAVVLAAEPRSMPPAAAPVEHVLETAPQVAASAAPALGDLAAPTPVQGQVVAAGPVPVIPTAEPTTVSKDPNYSLNSQVWGNVIHASQGDRADIRFNFKTSGHVRIEIFDRMGNSVAVLCDSDLPAGLYINHEYTWNGTDDQGGMAASGIYFVRIHTPDYTETHKLMLVK